MDFVHRTTIKFPMELLRDFKRIATRGKRGARKGALWEIKFIEKITEETPSLSLRSQGRRTYREILLRSCLILFPCETAESRLLLRRAVVDRLDLVRFVRVAGLGEIGEEGEYGLRNALVLSGIIPREESPACHQRQAENIRYVFPTNAPQTLQ